EQACAFMGELVGTPFPDDDNLPLRAARQDPTLRNELMTRAWIDWVAAECAHAPLLLVLEDLHWGDLPSVKLVEAALEGVGDLPLMVVALARPEIDDAFPNLWRRSSLHVLQLAPLRPRACERLARAVLDAGTSDADIARLIGRAGGNAFYLEELLRAFAEGNA